VKLPADVFIAPEKLTQYLLVPLERNDKSGFLRIGGYTLDNADLLLQHLQEHAQNMEAVPLENNIYGQLYEIRGRIVGPSGASLNICTIWMTEHLHGRTKFITLFPDKRERNDEIPPV